MDEKNTLYYGDNLDVLRRHIKDETVDLVYLDPPFNSAQDYNVLFKEQDGHRAAAQIKAFEDTWRWDLGAEAAYREIVEAGGPPSVAMQAFRAFLGESDMMAYLAMMAPRLVELRRVLKPAGSIYLHCDTTASHYLKVVMDAVFGAGNFRNEIIWKRTTAHSDSQRWSAVTDTILFYCKTDSMTWHSPRGELDPTYVSTKYRHTDADGRRYRLDNMTSPHPRPNMMYEWKGHASPPFGWRYSKDTMAKLDGEGRVWYPSDKKKRPQLKRYLDENTGRIIDNLWMDIPPINSQAQERLGYPTQKPEALLKRIITASSSEGGVVLDPFCGCGTAIAAAQKSNRRWIGIDITCLAITLIKHRLQHAFADQIAYEVIGEPVSLPDAETLAQEDPYQFQWWALGLVGARPVEGKKGADKGIDGRTFFHDEGAGSKTKQVIFSVKAGHTGPNHVRDLRGVLEREKAEIGALVTMQAPTQPMKAEAASVGFYEGWGGKKYPKLQILTVEELLAGKGVDMPPLEHVSVTFKKAPRAEKERPGQPELGL